MPNIYLDEKVKDGVLWHGPVSLLTDVFREVPTVGVIHQNEELLFGLAAVAVADDVGLLEPAQNLDFFQSGLHSSRGEAQTCLSKVGQTLLTHGSLT